MSKEPDHSSIARACTLYDVARTLTGNMSSGACLPAIHRGYAGSTAPITSEHNELRLFVVTTIEFGGPQKHDILVANGRYVVSVDNAPTPPNFYAQDILHMNHLDVSLSSHYSHFAPPKRPDYVTKIMADAVAIAENGARAKLSVLTPAG
jgi:hypothetical protein